MPLEITAYEIVDPEVIGPNDFGNECDWESTVQVYNIGVFGERQDHLADGRHKVDGRVFEFRAGSYGSYNYFREELANMLDYAGQQEIHERLFAGEKLEGPFIKLLNYADNEGVIGPRTCAVLARDFRDWLPHAERHWGCHKDGEGLLDLYRHFLVAFELAAGKGVVAFR